MAKEQSVIKPISAPKILSINTLEPVDSEKIMSCDPKLSILPAGRLNTFENILDDKSAASVPRNLKVFFIARADAIVRAVNNDKVAMPRMGRIRSGFTLKSSAILLIQIVLELFGPDRA
jgi:hypothetical protein